MYNSTKSITIDGINAISVTIETTITNGIPNFKIVGLSDRSIQEAKERIICAFKNSGIQIPARKIRINLSPSELYKSGTGLDLAIAISILGCFNSEFQNKSIYAFGELKLNGEIRNAKGAFQFLDYLSQLTQDKIDEPLFIFPYDSRLLTRFFPTLKICLVQNLKEILNIGKSSITNSSISPFVRSNELKSEKNQDKFEHDLSSINYINFVGNIKCKKALKISAAGKHHIFLTGPIGTGKSMIAKSLQALLPLPTPNEQAEIIKIHNLSSKSNIILNNVSINRPYREVNRNATPSSLYGTENSPGEFALANKGILFFDEFAEANLKIINLFREALEDKYITVNRARTNHTYPTDFIFIAATNLCACGKTGSKYENCKCSIIDKERYLKKIPLAILNRIDLFVNVNEVNLADISSLSITQEQQNYKIYLEQIKKVTELQLNRFTNEIYTCNSQIPFADFSKYCKLSEVAYKRINEAINKLRLNGRDYIKTVRISRTLSDFDNSEIIQDYHVEEALSYRNYLFEN